MAIVTLSLNPTIDVTSEADLVRPTHKIRTSNETYEPGGGGVNVARVIPSSAASATVICPAGGFPGQMLDELLGAIPIPRDDRADRRQHADQLHRLRAEDRARVPLHAERAEAVAGRDRRLPRRGAAAPSSTISSPAAACRSARRATSWRRSPRSSRRRARSSSSTSPAPASASRSSGRTVYLVKPSFGELEALAGRRLDHKTARGSGAPIWSSAAAPRSSRSPWAPPARWSSPRTRRSASQSPKVEARSAVGAGDAFVGAMTLALSRGRPIEDALMFATAAGAATALTPVAKVCAQARRHAPLRAGEARQCRTACRAHVHARDRLLEYAMSDRTQREAMDFDVVIVGAGPAGLAAAIRLKQVAPRALRRRPREGRRGRRAHPLRRGDRPDRPRRAPARTGGARRRRSRRR